METFCENECRVVQDFCNLKDYGFKDQITRAGLSIPSKIAEGYERNSNKEITNFLNYAQGSAGELRTQLYIAIEINHIERDTGRKWIQEAEEISKMLHGLIKTIRSREKQHVPLT
jgi:four helix bundle protein